MREKNSSSQFLKYSGMGLVIGATVGMIIGMVFSLDKVGEGLIFGALIGIVFGPAVGIMKDKRSTK